MGIDAKAVGLLVHCPDCKTEIKVPAESQTAPPSAPSKPPPVAPAMATRTPPAATLPLMTRPAMPPPRVAPPPPPVTPPQTNETASVTPADPRLAAEVKELKTTLERQAESYQQLAAERDELKKKLADAEAQGNVARQDAVRIKTGADAAREDTETKLAQALKENAQMLAGKNEMVANLEQLKKELEAARNANRQDAQGRENVTAKIQELEKNLKVTTTAAGHAAQAREAAEQKVKELESMVAGLNQKQAGIDAEREELHRDVKECEERHKAAMEKLADLANQRDHLVSANESLMAEIAELKSERVRLAKHQEESAALHRDLAEMKQQLTAMREQEQELVNTIKTKAEVKSVPETPQPPPLPPVEPVRQEPWVYSDPFRKMKRWMYIYAAIAACSVLGSIVFVMLWPRTPRDVSYPIDTSVVSPVSTAQHAGLGETVVIDDVAVTVDKIRIGKVTLISMLGAETPSDQDYLVLEVGMTNTSVDRDVILNGVWREARLTDNRGRRLKAAFNNPVMLEMVNGMIVDQMLKPGESARDLIIFEWEDREAESYTLTVDPAFRKSTGPDTASQISLASLTLEFQRAEIAAQ